MNEWINGVSEYQAAEKGDSQPRQPFYILLLLHVDHFPLLVLQKAGGGSKGSAGEKREDIFDCLYIGHKKWGYKLYGYDFMNSQPLQRLHCKGNYQ